MNVVVNVGVCRVWYKLIVLLKEFRGSVHIVAYNVTV